MRRILAFLVLGALLNAQTSSACSIFFLADAQPTMAKSYDYYFGHAHVITNKRNVEKTALQTQSGDQQAHWISEYGSLTFNQFGREFPHGGMNEAGLVVELARLSESVYPSDSSKPKLNELQWIQYILDTSGTVEDAIRNAQSVDVDSMFAKIHYMVCEPSGHCVVMEYLNGELAVHERDQLPWPIITNSPYQESVENLKNYVGFGGGNEIPSSEQSLDRFTRIADQIRTYDGDSPTQTAFRILQSVYQQNHTQWHTVYDLKNKIFRLKTDKSTVQTRFDMRAFSFDCRRSVKMLDIEDRIPGAAEPQFEYYTYRKNAELIRRSFQGLPNPPKNYEVLVQIMSLYPEQTRCKSLFIK